MIKKFNIKFKVKNEVLALIILIILIIDHMKCIHILTILIMILTHYQLINYLEKIEDGLNEVIVEDTLHRGRSFSKITF